MNWRSLVCLTRRQLFGYRRKEREQDCERPFRESVLEIKALFRRVLSAEHVLLYDYTGRPIPSDSELWKSASSEARERLYQTLDEIIDGFSQDEGPTHEKLRKAFRKSLQSDDGKPKYVFTPHDGKLTIPLSTKIGELQIQAALPLYKILSIIGIGAGLSSLRKSQLIGDSEKVPSVAAREDDTIHDLITSFALVIYIPEPLGSFLDGLRRKLDICDHAHAHISVLPPTALLQERNQAVEHARTLAQSWASFIIEATTIEVSLTENLIYLAIGAGHSELRRMHAAINSPDFYYKSFFAYHPRIELVRQVDHTFVPELQKQAAARWAEYSGDHSFIAARAVFVQNSTSNTWIDVAGFPLRAGNLPPGSIRPLEQ